MAKIYDIKTKKLLADLPKHRFTEVPALVMEGNGPLTAEELTLIEFAIGESEYIINSCHDDEEEVFMWYDEYLNKLINRMSRSLQKQGA